VIENDGTVGRVSSTEVRDADVARRRPVGGRDSGRRGLLLLRDGIEVLLDSLDGVSGDFPLQTGMGAGVSKMPKG
jgi:hypothetical protein